MATALWLATVVAPLPAQGPAIHFGTEVPADVRQIYDRGLKYLASTQQQDGSWRGTQQGAGITGLCLMAFLARGDDPNFGPYSVTVRRAVGHIMGSQNRKTGYIPSSMYHHGFAMLALAEAYGAVDELQIWPEATASDQRSIARALELAVRCAVTAQTKNKQGGWRYSPTSEDADTSVSGAVLMGLLAARNAGLEVPDQTVDRALQYFRNNTSDTGVVTYASGFGGSADSMNRSSVATLVFAIGKRKQWPQYQATLGHITQRLDSQEMSYPYYFRYYMAQALFQGDLDAWSRWKQENALILKQSQQDDGAIRSNFGEAYGTAMSLLSLALDYRLLPIYER